MCLENTGREYTKKKYGIRYVHIHVLALRRARERERERERERNSIQIT